MFQLVSFIAVAPDSTLLQTACCTAARSANRRGPQPAIGRYCDSDRGKANSGHTRRGVRSSQAIGGQIGQSSPAFDCQGPSWSLLFGPTE